MKLWAKVMLGGLALVVVGLALFVAMRVPLAGPDGRSGIEGLVLIGPMCPVVRPGESCPDKPFSAEVAVQTPSGREAARFRSDEEGRFRVALKPGTYTLVPKSNGIQMAPEAQVTVADGEFTPVRITYDSGIR